jgi:hypothetical protein
MEHINQYSKSRVWVGVGVGDSVGERRRNTYPPPQTDTYTLIFGECVCHK